MFGLCIFVDFPTTHTQETHRHRNTATQKHKDTATQRRNDTETQKHRDTKTQRHKDTETQRHEHIWVVDYILSNAHV